jgi:dienelactone hydrolase
MLRAFWMSLLVSMWALTAAAATPPIEAYGKLPALERVELSPSGDRYAIVGVVAGKRGLLVMGLDDKPVGSVTLGDRKINEIRWAGDDKVLIYYSATYDLSSHFVQSKQEVGHVVVLDLKSQKLTPILDKGLTGNGVWGTYAIVEEAGRWYGYFGGITLAKDINGDPVWEDGQPDLYKIDLETARETLVGKGADGENGSRHWLLAPNGAILATFQFNRRSGDWKLRRDKMGDLIIQGKAPLGGVGLIGQGRTPGTVVYYLDDQDAQEHWIEIPLSGGPGVEILPDEGVADALIESSTGLMIGYLRDGDLPQPVFFDPKRQARVRGMSKAFAGLNMTLVSWNDAFDRLIAYTDGPTDSGTWWLVDIRSGKADPLGHSYPQIPTEAVGPMKMVSYKAADGLAMDGVLTLPPGREAKNLPLVVFPHGGPAARDYPVFDWWAQAFAARGYAVFQPNFRGSTGYTRAFRDAAEGEWGAKMQTDLSDGVAELARQGIVDPKRACIMGASYGGYAALAGVTLQQGLYRCAVSVAGVSDLPRMYRYVTENYGAASPVARNWKVDVGKDVKPISPARLASAANAPILLIHGKDDTVVPVEQSRLMARELKQAGKPVEYIELTGEDHNLARSETRLQMLQAAVAFVEKHNPPN